MEISILKFMRKIPGGMMLVPLILGALINTFFPSALNIGGFTTDLFKTGTGPFIALFLFIMGSQIKIKEAGKPLTRGLVSLISKFLVGIVITLLVGHFFGMKGIIGITPLALMAALGSANTGLYVALAESYGSKVDMGAASMISLSGGAFFTMIALGGSGLAHIPIMSMVAVILPIVIGFILGNIDKDLRVFLGKGEHVLTPFFGFCIGAGMTFQSIIKSGFQGIILALAVLILTGGINYISHLIIFNERKAVNFAIGTTGGNQLATPAVIASAVPALASIAISAESQIATSVIITAILCPIIVGYIDNHIKGKSKNITKKTFIEETV